MFIHNTRLFIHLGVMPIVFYNGYNFSELFCLLHKYRDSVALTRQEIEEQFVLIEEDIACES